MSAQTLTTVKLVDDVDGSEAVATFNFYVNGQQYVVDLSAENAKKLQTVTMDYMDALNEIGVVEAGRPAKNGKPIRERNDLTAVRAWAKAKGLPVGERGRIPATILDAYNLEQDADA